MAHIPDYAYGAALLTQTGWPTVDGNRVRILFPDTWDIKPPCVSITPYGPTSVVAEAVLKVQRSSMQVDVWHTNGHQARLMAQLLERLTVGLKKVATVHGVVQQATVTSPHRVLPATDEVTAEADQIKRSMFIAEVLTIGEVD